MRIAPDVARRGHALVVNLPTEALWVHADAGRLEQVFSNLLINAAKYTPDGGENRADAGAPRKTRQRAHS